MGAALFFFMDSPQKNVRIYDFETEEVTTIPAAELAPGMVETEVIGMEGTYWVTLKNAKPGTIKHPPLNKKRRADVNKIMLSLRKVHPLTFQQWEEGFRRDLYIDREIDIWLRVAETFSDINRQFQLNSAQRKALFQVLVTCLQTRFEHVWQIMDRGELPIEIAEAAVESFYGQPTLKQEFAKLNPEDYRDFQGRVPFPVTALKDADAREVLKRADLIIGIDSYTRHTSIFFGLDRINKIKATGITEVLCSASVLYDSRTDQLEYLYVAVEMLKGSCCYGEK